jgi:hypothetical protein
MSYNRLLYDNCAYKQRINESVAPLYYNLNEIAYQNESNCSQDDPGFFIRQTSNVPKNPCLVDIESELLGVHRNASQCSANKYHPSCIKSTCGKGPEDNNKQTEGGLPCDDSCHNFELNSCSKKIVNYGEQPPFNQDRNKAFRTQQCNK